MTDAADPIPNELEALRAALLAERAARQEAEARASGLDAMAAHLKLLIAKLRQERFGASAERGARLDQPELQLEELNARYVNRPRFLCVSEARLQLDKLLKVFVVERIGLAHIAARTTDQTRRLADRTS